MKTLPWFVLSVGLAVLGGYTAKRWAMQQSAVLLLWATLVYGLSGATWLPILLHGNLNRWGPVWYLCALLGGWLLGVLVFGEPVTRTQLLAVCLALVAVWLLA